jgi:hypothetical protein
MTDMERANVLKSTEIRDYSNIYNAHEDARSILVDTHHFI